MLSLILSSKIISRNQYNFCFFHKKTEMGENYFNKAVFCSQLLRLSKTF